MTERRPWTVERLRLTAFLVATVDITAWPERWDAFGVVPDQTTRNAKVGSLQQVGPLPWNASGRLLFQAEPLKLEWLTLYEGDGGLDTVTFPLFNTERTQFELHMERWLRHNPPSISRLAFGAILRVPVEDQKGAYDSCKRNFVLNYHRWQATSSSE